MYDAQLNIVCVDGMLYACQGHDIPQFQKFLKQYDHEGSSMTLSIRRDPESIEHIYDSEQIYKELQMPEIR